LFILDIVWRNLSWFGVRHHRLGVSARRGARIGGGRPLSGRCQPGGSTEAFQQVAVGESNDGVAFSEHQESSKAGIEMTKTALLTTTKKQRERSWRSRKDEKDHLSTNMVFESSVTVVSLPFVNHLVLALEHNCEFGG
jgi:hypothetical protein